MSGDAIHAELDREVRRYVYEEIIERATVPGAAYVARGMGLAVDEVRASFRRLQDAHILVLQEGGAEILMAPPFSAVPTAFVVEIGERSWWGNCIWDAMGVVAMVRGDAVITTGCGDCNDAIVVQIEGGEARLDAGGAIIHFSIPARRWWDNIKFT
jgi:hypothetical protein